MCPVFLRCQSLLFSGCRETKAALPARVQVHPVITAASFLYLVVFFFVPFLKTETWDQLCLLDGAPRHLRFVNNSGYEEKSDIIGDIKY